MKCSSNLLKIYKWIINSTLEGQCIFMRVIYETHRYYNLVGVLLTHSANV